MTRPRTFENEDGDVWAPVEEYPEPGPVAQEWADNSGLVVSLDGQEARTVHDCECLTPQDACPDDPDGKPCRWREAVLCWHFYAYGDPSDFDRTDDLWFPHDAEGRTLILGHRYHPAGQHMPTGEEVLSCDASSWCGRTIQEHYREPVVAPGQTAAFEPKP